MSRDPIEFRDNLAKHIPGAEIVPGADKNSHYPELAIPAQKMRLCIRAPWRPENMMTVTAAPDDNGNFYNAPSANVTPTRPIKAIVADITRRVIEPAHAALVEYYTKRGREEMGEQFRRENLAAITAAIGVEPSKYSGQSHELIWSPKECPTWLKINSYGLREESPDHISASITVKNWHAFLQICHILKADAEL